MSATSFAYVRYALHHQVENIADNYAGTLLTQVLRAFVPFKCFSLDSDLKKKYFKKNTPFYSWITYGIQPLGCPIFMYETTYLLIYLSIYLVKKFMC